MADVKEMRIFCAEQIQVPDTLPELLKNYSKAVIRNNPQDIIAFSRKYFYILTFRYFEDLKAERDKNQKESEKQLDTQAKQ